MRETNGPDRVRWRLLQRFAPTEPGPKIPFAFPVKLHDGEKEQTITFSLVDFNVTTQITKLDLSQLHDITEIETLPAIEPPDHSWRWWTALAALVTLAIMSAFLRLMALPDHATDARTTRDSRMAAAHRHETSREG